MRVEIEHNVSDDKLSRELWEFKIETGYIKLEAFYIQSRPSTRHKFKGQKWDSMDERRYNSALSRPLSIPENVLLDAKKAWADAIGSVPIFIGWISEESRYEPTIK